MTQDEIIIAMALEAGYQSVYLCDAPIGRSYQFLERFSALVAAHEREKLLQPVECDGDFPEGFDVSIGIPAQALRTANAAMFDLIDKREWDVPCTAMHIIRYAEAAVLAEREACAKVCEERADSYKYATDPWAHEHISEANTCAAAIRARGAL